MTPQPDPRRLYRSLAQMAMIRTQRFDPPAPGHGKYSCPISRRQAWEKVA